MTKITRTFIASAAACLLAIMLMTVRCFAYDYSTITGTKASGAEVSGYSGALEVNVVDFGAFVDIGLHETGLIHISELSDSFVSDPMDVIKVGDVKEFTIIDLDTDRKRISLSLKSDAASRPAGGVSSGAKKKVVVVKKHSASGEKTSFDKNRKLRHEKQNFGSDDGMYYNPFAALLKK